MEKSNINPNSTEMSNVSHSNSYSAADSSSIKDVFSFAEKSRTKVLLGVGLLFSFLNGLMYPAMAWAFANTFSSFNSTDLMKDVGQMSLILVIIGLISFCFSLLQVSLLETAAAEMTISFKTKWFRSLLRQDMNFFDAENISGTAATISSNGNKFRRGVGKKLGEGIQFSVTFIGGLIYAFLVSFKTSLVLLGVVPVMAISSYILMKLTTEQSKATESSFANAAKVTYTTISKIKTVLSINLVEFMIKDFCRSTEEACQMAIKRVGWVGLANGIVMGSYLLSYLVLTLFGSFLIYESVRETGCDPSGADLSNECEQSGADVFGALMGISFAGVGIAQIGVTMEAFSLARSVCFYAKKAIDRKIGSIYEVKSTSQSESYKLPKYEIDSCSTEGSKPTFNKGDISFNNVSFCYPSRKEQMILAKFSLDIKSGTTIAIVGKSGCGKSSIMNLLMRLYDPTEGSISIDGNNLKDLNVKCLRSQISVVQQEPTLFATTIAKNIGYGKEDDASQIEIEAAARKANAHEFIKSFPKGYNTEVGENGSQLSGGQKQRIAIARAILKQPKILLLDEATSALDSESEKIVQSALDTLLVNSSGMSTIIVAHRLSTVRNADQIAVLSNGIIVELGSHDDLMKVSNGNYRKLVETQSRPSSEPEVKAGNESLVLNLNVEVKEEEKSAYLKFDNVTFAYPTRMEKNILEALDISVKKNETIALVGPSGCGKSSCLSLIERFYDPISGKITLNGQNINSYSLKDLRTKIGYVQQEPVLFDGTIAENISLGFDKASLKQIESAAEKANAHQFISSFPLGYQTVVGSGGLSGGQKQRIAIARAILREPEILLLDEATSALDSESEKIVQSALDELMKKSDQTTIVIAHRLSTIRNADRIALLMHGRVKELGSHEELMKINDGFYRRLVEIQESNASLDDEDFFGKVEEESELTVCSPEHPNLESAKDAIPDSELSTKLRKMAQEDILYIVIGTIGSMFTGAIFPLWGIIFAEMIDLLYRPVYCDGSLSDCSLYYETIADGIKRDSYIVSLWWALIILMAFVGYSLMFFGFGCASERLNKRIRNAAFMSLIRQEVAFFDDLNASSLTSQLQNDVNLLQAFTTQPIRIIVMNLCSVLVGIIISFYFMWPLALIAMATLPFYSAAAIIEQKLMMGEDETASDQESNAKLNYPGSIIIESLVQIKTVSCLSLEKKLSEKYAKALIEENPNYVKSNFLAGAVAGGGVAVQYLSFGLYFWWGGYLINKYQYSYNSFLISIFSLIFSLSGLAVAMQDVKSKEDATAAAQRLFSIIDRKSKIDPLKDLSENDINSSV